MMIKLPVKKDSRICKIM